MSFHKEKNIVKGIVKICKESKDNNNESSENLIFGKKNAINDGVTNSKHVQNIQITPP